MSLHVVVVGGGVGGLAAAVRLAHQGMRVTLVEARSSTGGLAGSEQWEGLRFDAGPYVLLDRPGLAWAWDELGLPLDAQLNLQPIEQVYEVASADSPPVRISHSLSQTAAGIDKNWPGSGADYGRFVEKTWTAYARMQPLQRVSRATTADLWRTGAWRSAPYLWRSLGSLLHTARLPLAVQDAVGVWTHVAGQTTNAAPGPMAFVPALIHHAGAWYPHAGIGQIPQKLAQAAQQAGAEVRCGRRVTAIRCAAGTVRGVEIDGAEFLSADAVVCDAHGVGAYLQLLDASALPQRSRTRLKRLALQSPGVCAYLAVRRSKASPYLRFYLPPSGEKCRLLVMPSALKSIDANGLTDEANQWHPARLIAPMGHVAAETGGEAGQRDFLERVLAESWWREPLDDVRVLATRLPCQWGDEFSLYRQSMNPVMTRQFMWTGRLAHRSPYVKGLYLTGSSTHPGQWVSFCAISGILAADCLRQDLG